MQKFVLYDSKSNRHICSGLLSHFQADRKNDDFRAKGRSTRWIPEDYLPENVDRSLIGLGELPAKRAAEQIV